MSPTPATPTPRLLVFPQVARPEPPAGRRALRRYSLTLISGARPLERLPRAAGTPPAAS